MDNDKINNPEHYTAGGIEVIDVLKAKMERQEFKGFLRGNVIKYLLRAELKGSEQEDYEKAQWYLNRLIQEIDDDEDDRIALQLSSTRPSDGAIPGIWVKPDSYIQPPFGERVLVYFKSGECKTALYVSHSAFNETMKFWKTDDGHYFDMEKVIAWMRLPDIED